MFQSLQTRQKNNTAVLAIDVAPLIDIIFILLIFFMVSTTFVPDRGIDVSRPRAVFSENLVGTPLRISIAASGAVYADGRFLDLEQLRDRVERFVGGNPDDGIVIIPDESISAGRLVTVIDSVRQAGGRDLTLATRTQP